MQRGQGSILAVLAISCAAAALDPAAYGNPSGQLRISEPPRREEYQERYTISVANRGESCFFLEDLRTNYILSLHYLVISSKSGGQLDISMRIKDPLNKLVTFQARKKEGSFSDYKVVTPGDYELCFNNKYSMYEHKKLMWELDIQGDEEQEGTEDNLQLVVNRTLAEFEASADSINSAIRKVRSGVARARHMQYWIKSKSSKDMERMESLVAMIDTWSSVYSLLVGLVGVAQVLLLKSFFNIRPPTSNLKMRT